MCGRYYVDEESNEELLRIIRNLDKRLQGQSIPIDSNKEGTHVPRPYKTGEIYPTNLAPVLAKKKEEVLPYAMTWGYPGFQGNNVIINARSESAAEKRMFCNSLISSRVVIPASGFYEWQHGGNKTKYYFTSLEHKPLYMAGISQQTKEEERFVILTTQANDSMIEIHDRMPVLLKEDEINAWLSSHEDAMSFLKRVPEQLQRDSATKNKAPEFEQLKFPW